MQYEHLFINCGNWTIRFEIDPRQYDNVNLCYIEYATRAIEIVFGMAEFTNDHDDFYALLNSDSINVLDHPGEWPNPTFTTTTHVISEYNGEPHKLITRLRTAQLFANAGQWENYRDALEAEEKER